jgi:hypothetical protein
VDIHLSAHIVNLTSLIRNRALVLYFQPFASIKLESLSAAFGWSPKYSEQQVVGLIQAGEIQARVDKKNKVSCAELDEIGPLEYGGVDILFFIGWLRSSKQKTPTSVLRCTLVL